MLFYYLLFLCLFITWLLNVRTYRYRARDCAIQWRRFSSHTFGRPGRTYLMFRLVLYFSLGHVYFDTWFFTVVQDPLRYLGRGKPLLSRILNKVSVSNPIKNQITRLCSVVEPTVLHIYVCRIFYYYRFTINFPVC